jgi:hypothetical protein
MSTFRPATRRIDPRRYRASRLERIYRRAWPERRYRLGRPEEVHATREADRSNGRGLVLAALLCAAVFAGAFALARDGRAVSAPREAAPWAFPADSAGAAIPLHLSGAPQIKVEAPRPKARTNTHSQAAEGGGVVATRPTLATAPLAEGTTPAPAAPTPPPVVTRSEPATPPPAEAPAATPRSSPSTPPASKGGSSGAPAETGKSFESSG